MPHIRADWMRHHIADKPADAFEPLNPLPFTLIWLHDESGESPAARPAFTAELGTRRLRCVAPHGGRSWWLDRVCPEFDTAVTAERHLTHQVVPWIEETFGTRAVALAGTGMGGQGAVRLGFRHPKQFPIVASADGAFDFHERHGQGTPLDAMYPTREHARQDTAILHIDAHDWPPHIWFACSPTSEWYRGNDRLAEKLRAIGVPHTADLDAPADPRQLIAPLLDFVVAALERQSRRLA
jgi:S-formylglutathione hydrolase